MNYQASNPESLSETPERLSETKTRSGSAAKKRVAEVLTSCTRSCMTCGETVKFARASPGSDIIPDPLPITIPTAAILDVDRRLNTSLETDSSLHHDCHP